MIKLNIKIILVIGISLSLLISCREDSTDWTDGLCGIYVASKKGFWLEVNSDNVKVDDISFYFKNKKIIPQRRETGVGSVSFLLKLNLKLRDTLSFRYGKKDYKIYNFSNLKETVIDGSNHERITICRVSTAEINGIKIQDVHNNILSVEVD
ncbi:hypothetical protein EV200_101573 [Pedobacter psychrotolerans]|uniref:Lipoprotein n=1 Tax=Pedobacter psychrotolerans TaxID=1843235 RepID=A0A4R2HMS6_9SPHI|nr:hypothetical protein [Pedobacter psychrotolerans]TCO31125.1 hypothetical protein EV200_101573 [Pedobacter psychrotolerans]GGE42039.1 hypothetical protein GCM10011413_04900 [Pedobacter psychrotolerans]